MRACAFGSGKRSDVDLEDLPSVSVARAAEVLALRHDFADLVQRYWPLNRETKTSRSCHQVGLFEGLSGLFARWQFQEQERLFETYAVFLSPCTYTSLLAVQFGSYLCC